ncbi:hypothetical protein AAZX31_16G118500, partial [Glycine max]
CIFRDFNDLPSNNEKIRLVDHPNWLINDFREVVSDCNLHDLPIEGYQYTWARRKGKHVEIQEKLDKGLATTDWIDLFPNFKLINEIATKSDHSPILICLNTAQRRRYKSHFKFENSFLLEPELQDIVQKGWSKNSFDELLAKFQNCFDEMNSWGRKIRC